MQTTELHFKLIKKIKDDRFDEDQLDHYVLLVQLGVRDVQTCVIDSRDNRVLLLEDFILPAASSASQWMTEVDELFDSHALLKANFWKEIKIAVKNTKFTLVPDKLFDASSLLKYLRFNAPVDPEKESFFFNKSSSSDVVTTFAIDTALNDWLQHTIYKNAKPNLYHQSAALIEGILEESTKRTDRPLYAYIDRFKLHLISGTNGMLLYYNQFPIKQFSDYVKYIMLVMKSLKMNPKTSQIVLWGYLGKNSPHYHEFYKYIQNVTFGDRPTQLKFGYMFDEVQEHHFFDLYSMYLLDNE